MASRTAYSTWTPQKPTLFDGHYLRKRSSLDIGVLGYIGIVQHKEHSPEVLSIPPGTPCISLCVGDCLVCRSGGTGIPDRHCTHCTGGWVGLRAGVYRCGKSRPTGIRSPDRPARRQSLYRLRYPAHSLHNK